MCYSVIGDEGFKVLCSFIAVMVKFPIILMLQLCPWLTFHFQFVLNYQSDTKIPFDYPFFMKTGDKIPALFKSPEKVFIWKFLDDFASLIVMWLSTRNIFNIEQSLCEKLKT